MEVLLQGAIVDILENDEIDNNVDYTCNES